MRTRSPLEICTPLAIFVAACALSLPTLVVAIAWMTLGVCSLGYRRLDDFPSDGVPANWLHGVRSACLLFYHLAWWPWYMRGELHEAATRIRRRFVRGRQSRDGRAASSQRADTRKH